MNYKLLNILVVFSGFYLIQFTIKPVYVVSSISILGYILFNLLISGKIYVNSLVRFNLIWIIYLITTQAFLKPDIGTAINAVLSPFCFFLSIQFLFSCKNRNLLKVYNRFINFSTMLLLVECVYRLANTAVDISDFYRFKMNSIMYEDSNFVGIFVLAILFFAIYLKVYESEKYDKQIYILIILCILTFSRAAIISMILFILIMYAKNLKKYSIFKKLIFMFFVIGGAGYTLSYIMPKIISDGSFNSKFFIISKAIEFIKNAPLDNLLFGVGLGNTVDYLGIGAHNIIIVYAIETGIIGLVMYVTFLIMLLLKTNFKACIVMIPNLIAGMSLAGVAVPFLYIIYGIIFYNEFNKSKFKLAEGRQTVNGESIGINPNV